MAEGVQVAIDGARKRYEALDSGDELVFLLQPGVAHEVTEEMWKVVEGFLAKHNMSSRI